MDDLKKKGADEIAKDLESKVEAAVKVEKEKIRDEFDDQIAGLNRQIFELKAQLQRAEAERAGMASKGALPPPTGFVAGTGMMPPPPSSGGIFNNSISVSFFFFFLLYHVILYLIDLLAVHRSHRFPSSPSNVWKYVISLYNHLFVFKCGFLTIFICFTLLHSASSTTRWWYPSSPWRR